MRGYFDQPKKRSDGGTRISGEWLMTGDLGYVADGELFDGIAVICSAAKIGETAGWRERATAAGLPSWQVDLQFFGPAAATLANWNYAKERILADIPGAKAIDGDHFPLPATEEQMLNTTQPYRSAIKRYGALGVPSLGMWRVVQDDGHVGFFPVLARSGEAVFEMQRVLGDALAEFGMNRFFNATSAPLYWHTFAFQMVFAPSVKRSDPERNAMVHRAMKKVVAVAAEHGWGDYRAAPIYQDDVADTYSFNNHALRRFHEQLKDAIDPDGVIAPGRGGIWPKRFRR